MQRTFNIIKYIQKVKETTVFLDCAPLCGSTNTASHVVPYTPLYLTLYALSIGRQPHLYKIYTLSDTVQVRLFYRSVADALKYTYQSLK